MKIDWKHGNKAPGDRIIKITSEKEELVSIYKLAVLVNQLAVNELSINREKIECTGDFYFKGAIIEAVRMAEGGVDWGEEKNLKEVKAWCEKYGLRFEKIEPELRKIQKSLREFLNGNKNRGTV